MKKVLCTLGAAALLFGIVSCGDKKAKEEVNQDQQKIEQLSAEYQQATSFNDSLMLLMGDIYTGLDSINAQEQLLYAPGQGDNANRRAEITHNLSAIKMRLAANRQVLDQLEARLNTSNNKNEVLARTIAQLKSRLDTQDQRVKELESQLADANAKIGQLTTQVAETQEQVKTETAAKEQAQQEATTANNELNVVYYAIGTNKELKKNNIISKKFMGATKVMKGDFNTAYFTKGDKRNLTVIPTSGKKIKLWSNNPAGSYQIITESNGTQSIKITDPARFWSISPYLIIQIDK